MNDRDRHLAEALVGRSEHRRFGDVGAGVEGRLDLGREIFSPPRMMMSFLRSTMNR